jgi:hypothetical protein
LNSIDDALKSNDRLRCYAYQSGFASAFALNYASSYDLTNTSAFTLFNNGLANLTIYGVLKYIYDSKLTNVVWEKVSQTRNYGQIPFIPEKDN